MRLPKLGLLMPIASSGDLDASVISGIGVSVGVKYFMPRPKGGWYVGGMLEFWSTSFEDSYEYWDEQGIVVCPNFGYKFMFPSGFFMRTGVMAGVSYVYDGYWFEKANSSNGGPDAGYLFFFGMAELSLGFLF